MGSERLAIRIEKWVCWGSGTIRREMNEPNEQVGNHFPEPAQPHFLSSVVSGPKKRGIGCFGYCVSIFGVSG